MRKAIEEHLGSAQVARVIYGAIIGLAVVVAIQAHPPGAAAVAATLVATALAVALAEIYSDLVATEVRTHERTAVRHLVHTIDDATAVFFGISFPAVFFALAALGALDLELAFDLARWTGLGLISFYGFCGARMSGSSVARSLLHALAVGLIGGFLIGFKALVH